MVDESRRRDKTILKLQAGRFIATRAADTLFVNLYPNAEVDAPELGARLSLSGDFPG